MSQFDFGTIDPSTKTGTVLATDLNSFRDALNSGHSGSVRPSYAVSGTEWIDNSTNPWTVYRYDGINDVTIGTINTTTHIFTPSGIFTSVKEFGAIGDGIADDTAALQAALDSNKICLIPAGKYRITNELVIEPNRNRNSGFIGESSWSNYSYTGQTGGPVWDGTKESIIYYDGVISSTAILRISDEVVGIEPTATFNSVIFGFKLHNILIDGNNKIDFGVYAVRMSEPDIFNCCIRGTIKHAWYINGNYSGQFNKISAILNKGCGISFGRALLDYGWSAQNKVNATFISDLYATGNGGDKTFNEITNPTWGYGIGLWLHRGNKVVQYTSENNDGPALVFAPTSTNNDIDTGYSELNSSYIVSGTSAIDDGRATRGWGLVFIGQASNASYANTIRNVFSATEGVRLAGLQPSSVRPEQGFEMVNLSGFNYLLSDWANYRLINCSEELVSGISGVAPTASAQFIGGIKFNGGNKLDKYEEGNFTPTLEGSSVQGTSWGYTVNSGAYTRIGNQIFFTMRIVLSAIGSGASGNVIIKGLPFLVKNSNAYYSAPNISRSSNLNTPVVCLTASAEINTNQLIILKRTSAAISETQLTISDIAATTTFVISGHYST